MAIVSLDTRKNPPLTFAERKPKLWYDERQLLLWGPLFRTEMTFSEADRFLSGLQLEGMNGWRLPYVHELSRLKTGAWHNDVLWPYSPYIPKRNGWLLTATYVLTASRRKRQPAYKNLRWLDSIKDGRGCYGEGLTGQVFPVRKMDAFVVTR